MTKPSERIQLISIQLHRIQCLSLHAESSLDDVEKDLYENHDLNFANKLAIQGTLQYLDEQAEDKKDDVDRFLDKAGFKPNPSNTID